MGRGSGQLAATNLFYDPAHKRSRSQRGDAQSMSSLSDIDPTRLNLGWYFIDCPIQVAGQDQGAFSGTDTWGAQVSKLPEQWEEHLGAASGPVLKSEAQFVLDSAIEQEEELSQRVAVKLETSIENPELVNAFKPQQPGSKIWGYFGRVNPEQQRAVEALVYPQKGRWVDHSIEAEHDPSIITKKLLYVGEEQQVLGWLTCL